MVTGSGRSRALPEGYEYVGPLKKGGTAEVVLARQVGIERLVAVKTLKTGVRDGTGLRRLKREGEVLASLQHPHIVKVLAFEARRGEMALVMEFVPGGDLQSLLASGSLGRAEAVTLLGQVAAALQHAHDQQIVHRDIKPANVLLEQSDVIRTAKVADFGLARLPRAVGAFRTHAGGSSGTPLYMAPEQIVRPDDELPANDVYSFSVLAYRLLVGQMPYPARTVAELKAAHRHHEPTPPMDVIQEFPSKAGRALLNGLTKDPARRSGLADLQFALRAVSDEEWNLLDERHPAPVEKPADLPPQVAPATMAEPTATATAAVAIAAVAGVAVARAVDIVHVDPTGDEPVASKQSRRPVVGSEPAPWQPPRQPLRLRRAAYLTLAIGLGSVLGVACAVLAGLR